MLSKSIKKFFNINNNNVIIAKKLKNFLAIRLNLNIELCEIISNLLGKNYFNIQSRIFNKKVKELKELNENGHLDNEINEFLEEIREMETFFYSAENLILEKVYLKYHVKVRIDHLKIVLQILELPFITSDELFPLLEEFVEDHERSIEEDAGLENQELFFREKITSLLEYTQSSTDCLMLKDSIEAYTQAQDLEDSANKSQGPSF